MDERIEPEPAPSEAADQATEAGGTTTPTLQGEPDREPVRLAYARTYIHMPGNVDFTSFQAPEDPAGYVAYPEAFPTAAQRDARLGWENAFVEFVRTTELEIKAGGFGLADVAIGPGLTDPGFHEVAAVVLSAKVAPFRRRIARGIDVTIEVIVARVQYSVTVPAIGPLAASTCAICSVYHPNTEGLEQVQTARWLQQALFAYLRGDAP